MGFFDFVKSAGEKLFGAKDAEAASEAAAAAPDDQAAQDNLAQINREAGDAIESYINSQNLTVTGLTVTFDGATGVATVFGVAADQSTKEKILLCCGNVNGVAQVNDQMSVDQSEPESSFYTVESGDTLSKIAKEQYGDANQYMQIFEANQPMLSSPDRIYPGQVLRIPA